MSKTLPPLPFAVFDEFGNGADDRVQDYGQACYESAIASQPAQRRLTDDELDAIRIKLTSERGRTRDYMLANAIMDAVGCRWPAAIIIPTVGNARENSTGGASREPGLSV